MEQLERAIKSAFNMLGFDLVRAPRFSCPALPPPAKAIAEKVAAAFGDSFPISPDCGLSAGEIDAQIGKYEWFAPFELGGKLVPPASEKALAARQRQRQRYGHVFGGLLSMTGGTLAGKRVLDIGCNSGFWSIQARRAGAEAVLGVDASAENIDQARLVARLIGLDRVSYDVANAYDISSASPGAFDVTFFIGILYHLDKPMLAVERLYDATRELAVVDTQLSGARSPMLRLEHDDVSYYHNQSHANSFALIPSEAAVVAMLRAAGFRQVLRVRPASSELPKVYLSGRWGTFIAVK